MNEEIMLANKSLHSFFFSHLNWTKEEDEQKKLGFYIETLELPKLTERMFGLIKYWPVMYCLNLIGFNKAAGIQNALTYASSSCIGGLLIESTEPVDFVKIGRVVQRVWLKADQLSCQLQPLTGVLFFALRIKNEGATGAFSILEQKKIMSSYLSAQKIFEADERHVAFMFRIGKGDNPSAQATRFPIEQVVTLSN
jgi:hypothetical protein